MVDNLIKLVLQTVKENLPPAAKYLVACSGGADSLALTDALALLKIKMAVCHVEHGLRGQESLRDAAFVKDFCQKRNLPYFVQKLNVPAYCQANGLSLEEGARTLRYQALEACAREQGAACILTAHQKDDQAETVLLHLLRGAGTAGLSGMEPVRCLAGGLILGRPLLSLSGADLRNYCRQRHLSWCEDSTNSDEAYTRNRIRKSLLPALKREFNPEIVEALSRMAACLRQDETYLGQQTEGASRRCLSVSPEGGVICKLNLWYQLPPALQSRVLQRQWQQVSGQSALSYVLMQSLQALCQQKHSGKKLLLPGGREAVYAYGELRMQAPAAEPDPVPGLKPLALNWAQIKGLLLISCKADRQLTLEQDEQTQPLLTLEIVQGLPPQPSADCCVYPLAEAQALGTELVLRTRLPGDIFAPYGGPGSKKLKEFFINMKIPRMLRAIIILAAVKKQILWVAGYRAAAWKNTGRYEEWLVIKLVKDRCRE